MKRKLVKQGKRALTVTLPSDWVQKNNLRPGDEIDLDEQNNVINLSTEKMPSLKEITVDVTGLLPHLADGFMARAYQKGYDKIRIKFNNQDLMRAIQNKVSELMGYEILKVGSDFLEIQTVSTNLDIDFDSMLRRGMLLLMDMCQTCHSAWVKKDKKALQHIFNQDYDVNKFLYFCLRSMNKSSQMMSFGRSILYYLVESLEDLGDELKVLGGILAELEPNKEMLNIIAKMNQMFRLSYEYFYKPEKEKAVEAFLLHKDTQKLIEKALKNKGVKEIKALTSIYFSTRIIYHLTTMRLDTLKELSGMGAVS